MNDCKVCRARQEEYDRRAARNHELAERLSRLQNVPLWLSDMIFDSDGDIRVFVQGFRSEQLKIDIENCRKTNQI